MNTFHVSSRAGDEHRHEEDGEGDGRKQQGRPRSMVVQHPGAIQALCRMPRKRRATGSGLRWRGPPGGEHGEDPGHEPRPAGAGGRAVRRRRRARTARPPARSSSSTSRLRQRSSSTPGTLRWRPRPWERWRRRRAWSRVRSTRHRAGRRGQGVRGQTHAAAEDRSIAETEEVGRHLALDDLVRSPADEAGQAQTQPGARASGERPRRRQAVRHTTAGQSRDLLDVPVDEPARPGRAERSRRSARTLFRPDPKAGAQ